MPTWRTRTDRRILLVWLALAFLQACGSTPVRAPVGDHSERPVLNPGYHKVRAGDTLYGVAWQYGYSVQELAAWNGLRPPYTIYTGQKLRVRPPARSHKPSARKRGTVRASQPKVGRTASRPARAAPRKAPPPKRPVARTAAPAGKTVQKVVWSWPARGRLIRRFNATAQGKKGIDIAGRSGDPVYAAADGKVVYAGSGLTGYGRLIIIKHNKDFLSAYAHNRKLLAREGQWIKRGQEIATMGDSGTDRTQLHFEIRKAGRPVDPLVYLPRR